MDRMVSTDLGIAAMQESLPIALRYPDFNHIPDFARDEFFEPYLLTARVELSIIQAKVVETVTQHLRLNEELKSVDMIAPCSKLILDWRERLPFNVSFSFEAGIPLPMLNLPFHRVLASLYLRYHQASLFL
jgi:proline utilization trans-activator